MQQTTGAKVTNIRSHQNKILYFIECKKKCLKNVNKVVQMMGKMMIKPARIWTACCQNEPVSKDKVRSKWDFFSV